MKGKRYPTLYRYCTYDLKIKKYKPQVADDVRVEMEKDIPYIRRKDSVLYRVRNEHGTDFCGFDNKKAAQREGYENLKLELNKLQKAAEDLQRTFNH